MVLESIFTAKSVEKHPLKMGILGVIIPSICILVAQMFGSGEKGLILVFLITIAMIPLMVKLMNIEEKRDIRLKDFSFWEKHGNMIEAYSLYFVAVALTLALWYFILPAEFTSNLFSEQMGEISKIRTGDFSALAGTSWSIITNNLYVMSIAFVSSFLFSAGAIFILTWNASVLGVVVGQIARDSFGSIAGIPIAFASFAPHGIPEVLAYFLAGLAGGILSKAVEKHSFLSENFKIVLWDSVKIFAAAVLLILGAGVLEAFIINFGA